MFNFKRLVSCKFTKIGCHWQGTFKNRVDHEERCAQSRKTGQEIMDSLEKMSKDEETKLGLFQSILSLLSYDTMVILGTWDDIYIVLNLSVLSKVKCGLSSNLSYF